MLEFVAGHVYFQDHQCVNCQKMSRDMVTAKDTIDGEEYLLCTECFHDKSGLTPEVREFQAAVKKWRDRL